LTKREIVSPPSSREVEGEPTSRRDKVDSVSPRREVASPSSSKDVKVEWKSRRGEFDSFLTERDVAPVADGSRRPKLANPSGLVVAANKLRYSLAKASGSV